LLPVDPTNHGNNYVRSVTRALAIMKFLSAHGGSSLTEVAKGVNIYKSTAHRLLTTLKDEGLIEQDAATAKYRLGFGLTVLASSVTADLDILRCARPVCERLSEQTQETVTISVLEGDDVVSIHQAISRSSAMNVNWIQPLDLLRPVSGVAGLSLICLFRWRGCLCHGRLLLFSGVGVLTGSPPPGLLVLRSRRCRWLRRGA
jgi:predicted transcriptional regulator